MVEVLEKPQKVAEEQKTIKICAMSDLHGFLPEIEECDLVLIAGDIVPLFEQNSKDLTKHWYLSKFIPWVDSLPCEKVLFIAGNHELYFSGRNLWVKEYFNKEYKATYLEHQEYIYKGIKIFGTPYCKLFGNWAFMYPNDILRALFANMPYDVDIVLSHDAPYETCDVLLETTPWNDGNNLGNIPLKEAIMERNPKLSIFGHLHSGLKGGLPINGTTYYNVSICTERYNPINDPTYINYDLIHT